MLSKENIPKGFKVLAQPSSLIIEYRDAITGSFTSSFLFAIFWIPFFLIFIHVYGLLKKYLSPILNEFLQHIFGEYIQNLGIKNFEIDGLCSLIFLGMIIIFIYVVVDACFGILEFQLLPEKLVINCKLLEIRRVQSIIPRNSILYFKKYAIDGQQGIAAWELQAVTNSSKMVLVYRAPVEYINWLGTVLANFYQVEFRQHSLDGSIPKGFKILSESPILVIQYRDQLSFKLKDIFCQIFFSLLGIPLFLSFLWLVILILDVTVFNNILHHSVIPKIPLLLWQFIYDSYIQNPSRVFMFFLIMLLYTFLTGSAIYSCLWNNFGLIEFQAFPEKLIVIYRLFGIQQTQLIFRNLLLYFQPYIRLDENDECCGLILKAITHQRRYSSLHSQVILFDGKPIEIEWLGTVLAEFYQVEFQQSQLKK